VKRKFTKGTTETSFCLSFGYSAVLHGRAASRGSSLRRLEQSRQDRQLMLPASSPEVSETPSLLSRHAHPPARLRVYSSL